MEGDTHQHPQHCTGGPSAKWGDDVHFNLKRHTRGKNFRHGRVEFAVSSPASKRRLRDSSSIVKRCGKDNAINQRVDFARAKNLTS